MALFASQSALSTEGYEVRVAKDGFAALAQMRRALPDLIVTDLKMPNMSGFEFLSVVRRRFPQIPTIAISEEFQPAVHPLGVLADAFFDKPFRFEGLLAKVTECWVTLLHARQSRGTDPRSGFPATGTTT